MKLSINNKKFQLMFGGLFIIVAIFAALYFFGVFNSKDTLVEYDGIPFSKGSVEAQFIQDYKSNPDEEDWKNQSDFSKIERAIAKRLTALSKALKSGKTTKIEKYFNETNREEYISYFEQNPEMMEELSAYTNNLEMTYLAAEPGEGSTYYRTAEYKNGADGIPVILVFVDGDWYIDSL